MGGLGSRSVDFRTSEMESRMDGRIRKWDWTGLVSGEGYYIGERVKCAMEGLLLFFVI